MNIIDIIDIIGLYSYILLFIIATFILFIYHRYNTLIIYTIGYFLTYIIGCIIKPIIKSPRPPNMVPFMGEVKFLTNSPIEKYGMPSGHASGATYTISFMWWSSYRIATPCFFWVGLFITACTFYQRWIYRRHTLIQIICGAILGGIMGWLIYHIGGEFLRTKSVL